MSLDVLTQLRSYTEQLDAQAASYEELAAPPTSPRRGEEPRQRRSRRGWAIAIAAAVITLLVIAVPLYLIGRGGDEAPVVTEPSPLPTVVTTVPPPTTEATATTEAAPTTAPAEPPTVPPSLSTSWERVPADVALENGWMSAVTIGGPGLVAVGGADDDAGVWVSADGVTWERIESDAFGSDGDQYMADVVAGPFGLVAVGADEVAGTHDFRAAVWVSDDGRTWSRVPHDEVALGGPGDQVMVRVTTGGPGLVAIGRSDDGTVEDVGVDDGNRVDGAVWVSTDGITWTRIADEVFEGGDESIEVMDITVWNDLLVVVGYSGAGFMDQPRRPGVWLSSDGLSWERLPDDGIDQDDFSQAWASLGMKAVAAYGDGLIAVGNRSAASAGVWTSHNGRDWELSPGEFYGDDPPTDRFWDSASVAELEGRLVASFTGSEILWGSDDGGATWHESAQFDGGARDLASPWAGTLNHVISTPTSLLAVGLVVEWSSTEDIGEECSQWWCRLDAAVWVGHWNE